MKECFKQKHVMIDGLRFKTRFTSDTVSRRIQKTSDFIQVLEVLKGIERKCREHLFLVSLHRKTTDRNIKREDLGKKSHQRVYLFEHILMFSQTK